MLAVETFVTKRTHLIEESYCFSNHSFHVPFKSLFSDLTIMEIKTIIERKIV